MCRRAGGVGCGCVSQNLERENFFAMFPQCFHSVSTMIKLHQDSTNTPPKVASDGSMESQDDELSCDESVVARSAPQIAL